ncbi:hypothetical protein Hanom_Chr10g00930351 [Helianthus anomalus]
MFLILWLMHVCRWTTLKVFHVLNIVVTADIMLLIVMYFYCR